MIRKAPDQISQLPNTGKASPKINILAKRKPAQTKQTKPISESAESEGSFFMACQLCAMLNCTAPSKKQKAIRNFVSFKAGANALNPLARYHCWPKTVPVKRPQRIAQELNR